MPTVTVLADETTEVEAELADTTAHIPRDELPTVLGWHLDGVGLCRGDVCVPVRERARVLPEGEDGPVDLVAVASALGRPAVVDPAAGVVAVGGPATDRVDALGGGPAPDFTLPDLDGRLRSLGEWGNRKRLLVAFASW